MVSQSWFSFSLPALDTLYPYMYNGIYKYPYGYIEGSGGRR